LETILGVFHGGAVLDLSVFAVWFALMFSSPRFVRFLAPAAVRRWADEQGYSIVRRRQAGPLTLLWLAVRAGPAQMLYWVDVQDKLGHLQEGVLQVGHRDFPSLVLSRCRVEVVRWEDKTPPRKSARSIAPAKLAL
jgi:hypothetical protein